MNDYPDILAIDDDQAFVSDLKSYFRSEGIGIAIISDPFLSSALDFAKFKIVLLDLDMPGRSGLEVLVGMLPNQKPIVIVVSGHSDLELLRDKQDENAASIMMRTQFWGREGRA